MKTYITRREQNDSLIILYGGWGTDESVFTPLCSDDFDFILYFNYSADEALIIPELKTYKSITLIGWSLGVWAADYLSAKTLFKPDLTIAVNGTPFPADDHYGIPLHIFEGTLNNFTEENINKFYLRMFGDKKTYLRHSDRIPHRSLKSLNDELRWFYNRIMEQNEPGFKWDYAVSSETDRVFPSRNLKNYWEKVPETKHIVLPLPHYFFHEWLSFNDFVCFVKNYNKSNQVSNNSKKVNTMGGL